MAIYDTYIQQLAFDGVEYTKGSVVDIYQTFSIVCQEFPFKRNPKSKDLPTRDWAGSDGLDVYVPTTLPVKDYEIDVIFLYKGTEQNIRTNIQNFIDFLYGRNNNAVGSRLAIYNRYVGMGRKDVVVSDVENELYYVAGWDPDAVAKFKIKFKVYDPTTEVTLTEVTNAQTGVTTVTDLSFS